MTREADGKAQLVRATSGHGANGHRSSGIHANAERILGKRYTYTLHRPIIAIGGLTLRNTRTLLMLDSKERQCTLLWVPITCLVWCNAFVSKAPLIRPMPYRRLGEASHPGPIVRMPGDGHCLYHALGWWAGKPQAQVRASIAGVADHTWYTLFPWDNGNALRTFQEETRNPQIWGPGPSSGRGGHMESLYHGTHAIW